MDDFLFPRSSRVRPGETLMRKRGACRAEMRRVLDEEEVRSVPHVV